MTYDSARARVIIFGGATPAVNLNTGLVALGDTWTFAIGEWVQGQSPSAPAATMNARMVYDSVRDVTILFGGFTGTATSAQMWRLDGDAWTSVTATTTPPARHSHAMVFDAVRQRTIMYGGVGPAGRLTWEYDGTDWMSVATTTRPPNIEGAVMVYDTVRSRVLLFGGRPGPSDVVWTYDGTDWSEVVAAGTTRPDERAQHAMAFDPLRDRLVLVGGQNLAGETLTDTWELGETGWTSVTIIGSTPGPYSAMVYDPVVAKSMVYGSTNGEMWLYNAPAVP